ncbi:MAG: protease inhibitor I42 family protein [Bacilli bacterium]|nr:protease inhibitor I42 family protein [Bacilli bacterium]
MMNKKLIIILTSLICILSITAIILFNVDEGKTLEITVTTNGGVPYSWQYEIEDEEIAKFVKKYTIEGDESLDGGPVSINFVFEGLKEGKTIVKLKYVNVKDNSIEKEKVYSVKVDKLKNISLSVIEN